LSSGPWRGNLLLLGGSVLLAYLAFEFLLFPGILVELPLDKQEYLRPEARILCQSSKDGTVPRPGYTALLGDSYALGMGDWLLEGDPGGRPEFSSAHVLRQLTGRDVVSFGRSGAGCMDGILVYPRADLRFLNSLWRFAVPAPGTLLVYFYEGDDLVETMVSVRRRAPSVEVPGLADPARAAAFVHRVVAEETPSPPLLSNLLFGRFLGKAVDRAVNRIIKGERRARNVLDASPGPQPPVRINRAQVAGTVVELPNYLQGPALDLADAEMDVSLAVLDACLAELASLPEFKDSRKIVVYLPSPLSCYDLATDTVHAARNAPGENRFPARLVRSRGERIFNAVRDAALAHGLDFVDPRPALREEARLKFIHGPRDWRHFNRDGYTVLARAVAAKLAP
jgi:hypothetical protein